MMHPGTIKMPLFCVGRRAIVREWLCRGQHTDRDQVRQEKVLPQ